MSDATTDARVACLLNGGASRRMGRAKGDLPLGHGTLRDWMLACLQRCDVQRVWLCGPGGLSDAHPGRGPLAGIDSGLRAAPEQAAVLFVPVDMPLLTPVHLNRLLNALKNGVDAVYYAAQPLPLVLRNDAALRAEVQARLCGTNPALRALLQACRCVQLPIGHDDVPCLMNVNTPADWARVQPGLLDAAASGPHTADDG